MWSTELQCWPLPSAQENTVFVPAASSVSLRRARREITRPSQVISIHISSIRSDLSIWVDIWNDEPTYRVYTAKLPPLSDARASPFQSRWPVSASSVQKSEKVVIYALLLLALFTVEVRNF